MSVQAVLREAEPRGDGRRVWVFLQACPTVPADGPNTNPPHAVADDTLEESDDGVGEYDLRRRGRRIGSPEDWQVRELIAAADIGRQADQPPGLLQPLEFGYEGKRVNGMRLLAAPGFTIYPEQGAECTPDAGWMLFYHSTHGWLLGAPGAKPFQIHERFADALHRTDRLMRSPRYHAARRLVRPGDLHRAALVEIDIPAAGIRRGDVLTAHSRTDRRLGDVPPVAGRARWLSLEDFEAVRTAGTGELIDMKPGPVWGTCGVAGIFRNRQRWGLQWKDRPEGWLSPVRVVTPVWPSQVRPIAAASDAAAIFELISESGCAMPREAHR